MIERVLSCTGANRLVVAGTLGLCTALYYHYPLLAVVGLDHRAIPWAVVFLPALAVVLRRPNAVVRGLEPVGPVPAGAEQKPATLEGLATLEESKHG